MELELKIGRTKLNLTINRETRETPEKLAADAAYIELNNLYLRIESRREKITVATGNKLRTLVGQAYDYGDPMIDWWMKEFSELPGWLNV